MGEALAVRYAKGAQVQVYRMVSGTLTPMGAAFTPANGMIADSALVSKTNLAVQFGDGFYVNVGGDVRKYAPGTGTWVAEVTPAFTLNAVHDHTGLYVGRSPTGVPRLFWCGIETGTGNYRAMWIDAGGAWTLGAAGPSAGTNLGSRGPSGNGVVYQNALHFGNARDILIYQVATDSFVKQNLGGAGGTDTHPTFARARGRLFMARTATGAPNEYTNIYEHVSGTYGLVVDGSVGIALPRLSGASALEVNSPCRELHYDVAADLLILHSYEDLGGATYGLSTYSIDPDTTAIADLTATTAPVAVAAPGGPDPLGDAHIHVQVDNDADPAAQVTTVYLLLADGAWEAFRWNGVAALMTSQGTGGDRGIALSKIQDGGGEYFYGGSTTAAPSHHVEEIQARTPISQGTRVYVRGYTFDESGGVPVVPDVTCGLYYSTTQQAPNSLATVTAVAKVSGPGTAPSLVGGKLSGMTMDGVTIYSLDWNAVGAVEVAQGQLHSLMPRIEV